MRPQRWPPLTLQCFSYERKMRQLHSRYFGSRVTRNMTKRASMVSGRITLWGAPFVMPLGPNRTYSGASPAPKITQLMTYKQSCSSHVQTLRTAW